MKKAQIIILWIIAILTGIFFMLILIAFAIAEPSLNCPETVFIPHTGIGFLSVGAGMLAIGLKHEWRKEKIAGLVLMPTGLLMLCLSRIINPFIKPPSIIPLFAVELLVLVFTATVPVVFGLSHADASDKKWKTLWEQEAERVLKTQIIDTSRTATTKATMGSALTRGALGGFIFGPIGGIAGATTAKQRITEKSTISFLVYYNDGGKEVKMVENGSKICQVYLSKLDESQSIL